MPTTSDNPATPEAEANPWLTPTTLISLTRAATEGTVITQRNGATPDSGSTGASVLVIALAAIIVIANTARPHTQQIVQLYIAAMDASGRPVTDLKTDEIVAREGGASADVVRLEPFRWPVKVTVLIDNGAPTAGWLAHYRTGLRKFFAALPRDVEASLIATAPNPRWLARPTTDRAKISKGVDLLTSDEALPRSNDAFVEYAERLDDDFRSISVERRQPYLPVLVSVGSTGRDGSSAQRDALVKMLNSLVKYRTVVNIAMMSPGGAGGLNDGIHAIVAKAVQEATRGRYEALAASSRLATLLPEIAASIAETHLRQTTQYRLTVERPAGAAGPVRDLQISVSRNGIKYILTSDGRIVG